MKWPFFDGCHDHKHQFEEKLCGFRHIAIILAVVFLKSLILLINRRKRIKISRWLSNVPIRVRTPALFSYLTPLE